MAVSDSLHGTTLREVSRDCWEGVVIHCSSYCQNVTKLSEEEYPLVGIACTRGLGVSFAIFLHGVEGKNDYILEFFMPLDIMDNIDSYVLNFVQKLKVEIEYASGFEMGDISSIEVIRPSSMVNYIASMTEFDTPNETIPHRYVINIATTVCGAYANVSMQKTRDKGNDAGEPSNHLIRNIKRKRDSYIGGMLSKLSDRSARVTHSNQHLLVSKVIRPPSVVNNVSSMKELDTPNEIISHGYVKNVATIACGTYANMSMQIKRDMGNDAGEPSNHLIRNIKPKRDSLTVEMVKKQSGKPMDELVKSLKASPPICIQVFLVFQFLLLFIPLFGLFPVSRSTLKHFIRDHSMNKWPPSKLSSISACVTDSKQHLPVSTNKSACVLSLEELIIMRFTNGDRIETKEFLRLERITLTEVDMLVLCSSNPLMARNALAHQNNPVVFDNTTYTEQATNNVDPLMARTALANQNDPVVFDSTTIMEQATYNVDPLMARTAMAYQNDPVVYDSTPYMEHATHNLDPLMVRIAMAHQNDPVVFDITTYIEQATNNVDPCMDVDLDLVTDLNLVDAFPRSSGADFFDDPCSFLMMAGCSSDFGLDYLMEPDGIKNAIAKTRSRLEGSWPPPTGSGDMDLFGANTSDYDFSDLLFDDKLF
uniref:NLP1-9 GAF domain-containing protein n=1 Tax=Tanacetum cinerariifolium TaxID=118510 RepID=A0A6L2JRV3_TANCI|nr:hypothetical protein [Tanacetum cinerariifolium]